VRSPQEGKSTALRWYIHPASCCNGSLLVTLWFAGLLLGRAGHQFAVLQGHNVSVDRIFARPDDGHHSPFPKSSDINAIWKHTVQNSCDVLTVAADLRARSYFARLEGIKTVLGLPEPTNNAPRQIQSEGDA
jgi:hypothetical protein